MSAANTDERSARNHPAPQGNLTNGLAASHLRFARLYLDRDAEKARGYLQRAIDAAPESDVAEEARELLEQLGDPD